MFETLLQNPEKIKDLTNEEKTTLYLNLKKKKEDLNNKIAERKAKKTYLEEQKEKIQSELFKEANVKTMEELVAYVKDLQEEFNKALNEETILVSDAMTKLNLN